LKQEAFKTLRMKNNQLKTERLNG